MGCYLPCLFSGFYNLDSLISGCKTAAKDYDAQVTATQKAFPAFLLSLVLVTLQHVRTSEISCTRAAENPTLASWQSGAGVPSSDMVILVILVGCIGFSWHNLRLSYLTLR